MANHAPLPPELNNFSKRTFHIGITFMLIQNVLLLVPIVIVFIYPTFAIIIFYLSLWLDILAIVLLIFGILGMLSDLSPNEIKDVKLIVSLFLIWLLLSVFWRILAATNTGISVLQDKSLYFYLLLVWVGAGLIYSLAIILFKDFLKELYFRDYRFVTLYALANVFAMLIILIGLVFAQPAIDQIASGLIISSENQNTILLQVAILSIGVLIKITIIPLLGIGTFYTIRLTSLEILSFEDSNEFSKKTKGNYTNFSTKYTKFKPRYKK